MNHILNLPWLISPLFPPLLTASASPPLSPLTATSSHLQSYLPPNLPTTFREVAAVLAWIDRGAKPPRPDQEITVIRQLIADLADPDKEH